MPVDASVAAILRATWPDLPMPEQATRPRQSRMARQARLKSPSMRAATASSPSRSIAKARLPLAAKSNAVAGAVCGSAGIGRHAPLNWVVQFT